MEPLLVGEEVPHMYRLQTKRSLNFIMVQRVVGSEYQRWVGQSTGFEFDIQYNSVALNHVGDALSRKLT